MANCIDCNLITKRKDAKRCEKCWLKYKSENAHGRIIGIFCKLCNKELTVKKNKTGICLKCLRENGLIKSNGIKGRIPWNKGISIFRNKEEKIFHQNKLRRNRYSKMTNEIKIADRIRTLIRNSIRYKAIKRKSSKTSILLGCDIESFKKYLENNFEKGMSWENYGNGINKWNIDHTKPISLFNLNIFEQQKIAFNYKNCKPMWSIDNFKKNNKF